MKTNNGYCITHEYSGSTPSVVTTHRTLEAAQAKLDKSRRAFRRANPSTFPTRAIFPLALRELVNGQAGQRVEQE